VKRISGAFNSCKFRGVQSGSKRAEAYIVQLGSPYDIISLCKL